MIGAQSYKSEISPLIFQSIFWGVVTWVDEFGQNHQISKMRSFWGTLIEIGHIVILKGSKVWQFLSLKNVLDPCVEIRNYAPEIEVYIDNFHKHSQLAV